MSKQAKVTDFFVAQKRCDIGLRSVNKSGKNVIELTANESTSGEQMVAEKTPKRKNLVTNNKSLKSSKRKKTPKNEVIIEFKTKNGKNANELIESTIATKDMNQLNANEVKKRLLKCNNLSELKKQLSTINDCAKKVKEFKEMKVQSPKKKGFRTPTNRSPSKQWSNQALISNSFSPLRSPTLPPIKSPVRLIPNTDSASAQTYRRRLFDVFEDESSPGKAVTNSKDSVPAFERFGYLVNKSEVENELVLPKKLKVLADLFKAMDTIVSMHYRRQEVTTFDKLKESVERMTSKVFDSKRLAQIQTIFGDAFKLKYELFSNTLSNRKPIHQLIISPIYNSNIDLTLSSGHLLERYQIFVAKLLDITKQHHNQWLTRLGVSVDSKQLVRWHPKFQLDSVPDIVPNDNALPVRPKFGESSAEQFLQTSRQKLGIPSKIETTDQTQDINSNDNQNDNNTNETNKKITKGLLKGISVDLLNKIRAKEAANLAQEMTRKPEVEKELTILRTLPEIIRIIHAFFVGSKKIAIPYDQLIDKIIDSFNISLSILRAREHVDYLCRTLPDWMYKLEVKKGNYIKINKDMTLSKLEDRIKRKFNQLKA